MPTPTGLPKVGEIWEHTRSLPPDWKPQTVRFVVLARGRGDYWSLKRAILVEENGRKFFKLHLWVDPANAFRLDELKYIGPAGPKTKKALGLG